MNLEVEGASNEILGKMYRVFTKLTLICRTFDVQRFGNTHKIRLCVRFHRQSPRLQITLVKSKYTKIQVIRHIWLCTILKENFQVIFYIQVDNFITLIVRDCLTEINETCINFDGWYLICRHPKTSCVKCILSYLLWIKKKNKTKKVGWIAWS